MKKKKVLAILGTTALVANLGYASLVLAQDATGTQTIGCPSGATTLAVVDPLAVSVDGSLIDPSEYFLQSVAFAARTAQFWPPGGGTTVADAEVVSFTTADINGANPTTNLTSTYTSGSQDVSVSIQVTNNTPAAQGSNCTYKADVTVQAASEGLYKDLFGNDNAPGGGDDRTIPTDENYIQPNISGELLTSTVTDIVPATSFDFVEDTPTEVYSEFFVENGVPQGNWVSQPNFTADSTSDVLQAGDYEGVIAFTVDLSAPGTYSPNP